MDVYCTTCGEPWDHNHLWQDAVHETNLDEQEIKVWKKLLKAELAEGAPDNDIEGTKDELEKTEQSYEAIDEEI